MPSKLHRIRRIPNPNYKRSGFKSYGYVLQKHFITPTTEGPFTVANQVEHQGKFNGLVSNGDSQVGGKTVVKPYLLQKIDASGNVGDVPAEDIQHDLEYVCEVGIGSPAQTLRLDFDTGSSDLWVWSTDMSGPTPNASQHTKFNPSKSTTFQKMDGSYWKIGFGDGSQAQGHNVGTDNVNIGGLIVENQAVELADNLSQQLLTGDGDGLLGLAWDSINTVKPQKVKTPPSNMVEQGDITEALFTAHLGNWHDADDPTKGGSFYTFGYIDQDVLAASGVTDPTKIWYAPVNNSQGFWQFESSSFSVNGEVIQRERGNTAIADTGTSLAIVSDDVCEKIYSAIPGARYAKNVQAFVIPTNVATSQLPDVQLDVGGKLFSVLKQDLLYHDLGNGYTYGGIQSRGNMPFDILGDTFLKGIYAIFDCGNKQFGAVQRTP